MEKKSHRRTCQEFEAFKHSATAEAGVRPIVGSSMDLLSPTVPSTVGLESYYST